MDGLYADSRPSIAALVLSHAHLDHYGLSHYAHPDFPVYGSPGTIAMLRAAKLFIPNASVPENLHELPMQEIRLESFRVRGIPVDHVAPDSRALLVEADGERLLYSGDLRAHGRNRHVFDVLPEAAGPIDVLILEGTTVGQCLGSHGSQNEEDVEHRLAALLKRDKRLVVVIASGQNMDRAVSVYRAALAAGRELVLDPYQAYIHLTLRKIYPEAPQYDSPSVRVKFVASHVAKLKEAGLWGLACRMSRASKVSKEQMKAEPARFVCLARSSAATVALLRALEPATEPIIVWSLWSGYLKRGGPVPRYCADRGITSQTIHSGGHAHPEDLCELVRRLNPKVVIPIHTEEVNAFSDLLPRVRIVPDGQAVAMVDLMKP